MHWFAFITWDFTLFNLFTIIYTKLIHYVYLPSGLISWVHKYVISNMLKTVFFFNLVLYIYIYRCKIFLLDILNIFLK